MNKIILIILISMSIFIVGCESGQTKQTQLQNSSGNLSVPSSTDTAGKATAKPVDDKDIAVNIILKKLSARDDG